MSHTSEQSTRRRKAYEDIEFLASSWNRLDVLEAVTDTPQTRNELKERTDVSRVTLSRILSDLENRGWIRRETDQFEATASGAFVASEVTRLLDNMVVAEDLGSALEWLPIEQFEFDFRHLRDVTVITPDQTDFTAPTRKLVDLAYQCASIRGIPTGITPQFIGALREETVNDSLTVEFLLPPDVFEIISNDAELRRQFLDMADSGNAKIFHYEGDAPLMMLGIFDEKVMICGHKGEGAPPGTIETTEGAIRSWADSYFDARCADASLLEPETFTA